MEVSLFFGFLPSANSHWVSPLHLFLYLRHYPPFFISELVVVTMNRQKNEPLIANAAEIAALLATPVVALKQLQHSARCAVLCVVIAVLLSVLRELI